MVWSCASGHLPHEGEGETMRMTVSGGEMLSPAACGGRSHETFHTAKER